MSQTPAPAIGTTWTPQTVVGAVLLVVSAIGGGYGAITSKGTSDEVRELKRVMKEANLNKEHIEDMLKRIEALEAAKK